MPAHSLRLDGKVAVVTGASQGIGRAIAHAFAQAGARVALASRTQSDLDAVARAITEAGGVAMAVAAHTGDDDAVAALVERVADEWGGVDILVNNAATNPHYGPMLSAEMSQWDTIWNVNVKGYVRMIRACAPSMAERGGGSVINVASIAGERAMPGMGVYGVSKAAVLMMTEALGAELAPAIRVNAIVPGFVKTQFSSVLWQDESNAQQLTRMIPQRRIAEPDELAPLALYLASDASAFVTGARFRIDGGQLAR